jgi:hypothetical protein
MIKKCKNPGCNKLIPSIKIDTLGRINSRTSNYCSDYCRNKYLTTITHPNYFKEYYQNNKEKYYVKREQGL